MAYLELIEQVVDHVREHGVKVSYERGEPLKDKDIKRAQKRALIPILASLAAFYLEVGDGLNIFWTTSDEAGPIGGNEIPTLKDCSPRSRRQVNWLPEWQDDYDFSDMPDPALAKDTALRMRRWMPFHSEDTGDSISLDTAMDPAPVVFNKHDWHDGGTGANGHRMAGSLLEFYSEWAQVCFQIPNNLRWPSVFNKDGLGMNWASEEFHESFRLPRN